MTEPFERHNIARLTLATLGVAMLGACAGLPPPGEAASLASVPVAAPPQWQAALPHGGQLTDLARWWQQFDDPLLTQLIDAAQAVSPTLASRRRARRAYRLAPLLARP